MVIPMYRLIQLEWIKFIESRKNRMILLIMILYIIGIVFYNQYQYRHYFSNVEKSMTAERNKASSYLNIIQLLKKNDANYKENPDELLFLNTEIKKSLLLEYFFKDLNLEDWKYVLQTENQKFSNLIWGEENKFIKGTILNARGQNPLFMKSKIIQNQYLIDNNIVPYINPYEINGINFLLLLLNRHTPLILIILAVLLSIDIFSGEMEEGTYKLYFTQPYSRKTIYWSKIFSILFFSIGIIAVLIILFFIIICVIFGFGEPTYPQVIATSQVLLSFRNNINLLGNFQVVSSIKFIALGYVLLFFISSMILISSIFLSIVFKSTTKSIGVFTYIILIAFVFNMYVEDKSLLRFYSIFSYVRIEEVIKGQINTSYIIGITITMFSSIFILKLGKGFLTKIDLVGGEK